MSGVIFLVISGAFNIVKEYSKCENFPIEMRNRSAYPSGILKYTLDVIEPVDG